MLTLNIDGRNHSIAIRSLAIAGWAGRDQAHVQEHIEELAALGVAPPSATPLFYRCDPTQLTQTEEVQVLGGSSSGEAEVCLIVDEQRRLWISLASDHTDRELESYSVAFSKQLCIKPLAHQAWNYADVAGHWDQLILRSEIEENGQQVGYQQGTLAELLDIPTLLARLPADLQDEQGILPGTALLCGTVPAIGGIRPSGSFSMSLVDPVLGRTLSHHYQTRSLPVVK